MSTRSQIIIKDDYSEQWFYRHSDGYPSGNLPQLFKFMSWLKEGKIRNNVEQSSGWLILIGADEYGYDYNFDTDKKTRRKNLFKPNGKKLGCGWKCGAYEICSCKELHGDVEWLYTIDLQDDTIEILDVRSDKKKKFTFEELKRRKGDWISLENLWGCLRCQQ